MFEVGRSMFGVRLNLDGHYHEHELHAFSLGGDARRWPLHSASCHFMRTRNIMRIALVIGFLGMALTTALAADTPPIDRQAVVSRHNVVIHEIDPNGTMAVGNGEFAFNFDVTGLQSFPDYYQKTMPLGILSNWGWHSFPNPDGFSFDKFKLKSIPKHDREFVYPASGTNHPTPEAAYLRANPNRFGLGRIGLEMIHADGSPVVITDLKNITETLDLWTGHVDSRFEVDGIPVKVRTAASPDTDRIGTRIESPLIASGRLKLRIAFAYASTSFGPDYQDWNHPQAHTTVMAQIDNHADFQRTLDDTHYHVQAEWSPDCTLSKTAEHQYLLSSTANRIDFSAWFMQGTEQVVVDHQRKDNIEADAAAYWQNYWNTGGILDLSGNTDPRAAELERRIVLSQYVMAVHDGGSLPPQETGLAANSWYGKFHMEMYWWHAAHWGLWGHPEILAKSLDHLPDMMPFGEMMAKKEGCKGVKWSKMTDPSGTESPSGVGPVLCWQQPHPIYLCELMYRAKKDRATLDRYKRIVFETADYMASFVDYDSARKEYVLGSGVSSGDEKHTDVEHNLNPTMELGYWKWALETAQQWRLRLNMPPDPKWQDVMGHLAKPTVRNGIYPALEIPEETKPAFMATWLCGVLPGEGIDKEAMRATLHGTTKTDVPQNTITWGTAMAAMCAARLNEPDRAVDTLVGKFDTNPFRPSGYTVRRPEQTPMYMPANGGWLSAIAMMAAGWDGNTIGSPGFPKTWKVRYEGILPMP